MKNIGRLSLVDHRSVPSVASNERTVRSENPTTIAPPEIAGADAKRASPLISSSQFVVAVGRIERDEMRTRRPVSLDGRDDGPA